MDGYGAGMMPGMQGAGGVGMNINDPEMQKAYLELMAQYGGLAPKEKQAMIQQKMAESLRSMTSAPARSGAGALAQGLSGLGQGMMLKKSGDLQTEMMQGRNEAYQKFIQKFGRPPKSDQELQQMVASGQIDAGGVAGQTPGVV